jgi:ribosomal protein S18 acetylase RimI-like enzyme
MSAGGLFEEQLKKRNIYMLYAVREAHPATSQPGPSHVLSTSKTDHDHVRSKQHNHLQQQQQQQRQEEAGVQQQASSTVLGYIVVQVNSVTAHINKLAVAPEARRSGLATHLLQVSQPLGHLLLTCAAY